MRGAAALNRHALIGTPWWQNHSKSKIGRATLRSLSI
jgi:hypothetical protein